jgi:hypothetical protein
MLTVGWKLPPVIQLEQGSVSPQVSSRASYSTPLVASSFTMHGTSVAEEMTASTSAESVATAYHSARRQRLQPPSESLQQVRPE